jgi:hypothetical protein
MGLTNDEIKERLKAKMEAEIEKLMAEKRPPEEITLSEIERAAYQAGEALKEGITAGLVEQVSRSEGAAPGPHCPKCGKEMHYKGRKPKYVVTETGRVTIERAYYYCETCKDGLFPPG